MIKVGNVELKQERFPDGTLHLKGVKDVNGSMRHLWFHWYYENDAELFSLICARRHFQNKPATLYLPYIPHARMDRVKTNDDVFTLKYFCEVINSLNFEEVIVLDAHSNVSLALLNNVREWNIAGDLDEAIRLSKAEVLFFPDEGAMKRYASDHSTMPYAFGIKKRNWETGKIEGLDIMNEELVKEKRVLIIDDICSRGGTFYHAAKRLQEAGAANISLYVTHLEETVLEGDLWKEMEEGTSPVERIYTGNPLFNLDDYKHTIKDKIVNIDRKVESEL